MNFSKNERDAKPSIETSHSEFHHANNLQYGRGRLLWAGALHRDNGTQLPEGWVLPGGRRTQDAEEALRAAQYIDSISR
jgi:hypothetical protein